jgi:hypothetical protein
MVSAPTESPRKTFYDCIMRLVVCMEDIALRVLPHGADDMIGIYENRIEFLERNGRPTRVDVPVKVNAIVVQARQLARLHEQQRYEI